MKRIAIIHSGEKDLLTAMRLHTMLEAYGFDSKVFSKEAREGFRKFDLVIGFALQAKPTAEFRLLFDQLVWKRVMFTLPGLFPPSCNYFVVSPDDPSDVISLLKECAYLTNNGLLAPCVLAVALVLFESSAEARS